MTSLNSLGVAIRLVFTVVSNKIIAELLGQAGVAQIGKIRNILPMIESIATLGIFNGIVKYVAEFKDDKTELQKLFSTAFVFLMFTVSLVFLVLFFFGNFFSELIFGNTEYNYVFKLLAVAVPFIALNRFFLGIVNGLSAYKSFVKINLIAYISGVLLLIASVYYKNLNGALFAIAITPIIHFSCLFFLFLKTIKEYLNYKDLKFTIPYKNKLLVFTVMSLTSTFLMNAIELDIRGQIENKIGIESAGDWTQMTFISRNYFLFVASLFTLYVIPKFATIYTNKDFKKEVINIYKTLLPIFGLGLIAIFVCKKLLIQVILTDDFLSMIPLFKWQLLGDFIKIAAMVLGYQFIAKKMWKHFIITELISLILFYSLSHYFIKDYGAEGVVIAHFLRYIVYFVLLILIFRKALIFNKESNLTPNS